MSGGYSSPPCYASEVAPDYFGAVAPITRSELQALLRRLLADEQAATSAAAAFMNDQEAGGTAWKQFAVLQRCGIKNCATLAELIRSLGDGDGGPSESVAGNAPVSRVPRSRVEWLVCGQRRIARSIHDALPNIEQDFVRCALAEMEDSHLFNIEACEALAETL